MTCPRCKHDHPPVSFTAWAWAVRDAVRDSKPKPPAGQVAVLFVLGSRLDPVTGCGWVSRPGLMADLGVKADTVTRATVWALDRGLLHRIVRGGNRWEGEVTQSLWTITRPPIGAGEPATTQTGTVAQQRKRGPLPDDLAIQQTGTVAQRSPFAAHNGPHLRPISKTREVRPVKEPNPTGSAAVGGELALIPPADAGVTAGPSGPTAQDLLAEWIDHCPAGRPPGRIVGQIAKSLGRLLNEDKIAYEYVRDGLAMWHLKGNLNPSTLDGFVNAAMNGHRPGARRGNADERDARAAAAVEYLRTLEQQQQEGPG